MQNIKLYELTKGSSWGGGEEHLAFSLDKQALKQVAAELDKVALGDMQWFKAEGTPDETCPYKRIPLLVSGVGDTYYCINEIEMVRRA